MNPTQKFQTYGLMLFSVLTSFLFVFYTINVYFSESAGTWLKSFAYVTGGYGLLNIYILSWAWNSRSQWAVKADILIAGCFIGVVIMNTLRSSTTDAITGSATIIAVAAVLIVNVYAVKAVCARQKTQDIYSRMNKSFKDK